VSSTAAHVPTSPTSEHRRALAVGIDDRRVEQRARITARLGDRVLDALALVEGGDVADRDSRTDWAISSMLEAARLAARPSSPGLQQLVGGRLAARAIRSAPRAARWWRVAAPSTSRRRRPERGADASAPARGLPAPSSPIAYRAA
jgi:hypothetical protein